MQKIFEKIKQFCKDAAETLFFILCLGVISQLLIGKPILGWDVLSNITQLINLLGNNGFIGVVVTLLLFMIFIRK